MSTTTIIYSIAKSSAIQLLPTGQSGYQVTIAITQAVNIDPNVFVLQREVPSNDADAFVDTFYSVASVAQMAALPTSGSFENPFYRVSSISLIFRNLQELNFYTQEILNLIEALRSANDLAINMLPTETAAFPLNTLVRFYGLSSTSTITQDILNAALQDYVYSQVASLSLPNDAGAQYVFFAVRADLPTVTNFLVNSASVAFTKTTMSVTNSNGYSASYNIYVSNTTYTGTPITLSTS